jgi:hypothetical protein
VPGGQHHEDAARRAFAEELERLQPTEGYMRLLKDTVLQGWRERKAAVRAEVADVERRVAAIRQKLDQLDDAFLFAKTIDIETYDRTAKGCSENSHSLRLTGTRRSWRSST